MHSDLDSFAESDVHLSAWNVEVGLPDRIGELWFPPSTSPGYVATHREAGNQENAYQRSENGDHGHD